MNNQHAYEPADRSTIRYSRRDRVVQVLGALGISAAVWGLVAVSGGSSLPTIALSDASNVPTASAGAESTADNKMAIWSPTNYEFVLDAGVDIAASKEAVYRWVGPTLADVQSLADKLGVDGDIKELPADQGGGWSIGDPNNVSAGNVYFVVMSNGSFSYSLMSSIKVGAMCGAPVPPEASGATSNDPCADTPEPTKNLPTEAAAKSKFVEFFGNSATELTDVTVYADAYSVYVYGAHRVGPSLLGDAAKQWMSLTFGENGMITSAGSMLGHLEEVGAYPTISARDAVERLSQMPLLFAARDGAVSSGSGVEAGSSGPSDTVLVDPIPVPSDTVPGTDSTIEPTPVDSVPVPTPPVAPSTTVPVQTISVRLVKVTVVYQQVWDVKGTIWVLPTYQYTDGDGGMWFANAVSSKYLDIVTPSPMVMNKAAAE